MDSIISLNDRDYLKKLINYNKILSQRNSLLKYFAANHIFDTLNIEVYNEQLITYGEELFTKREKFIKEFVPIFKSRYQHIIRKVTDKTAIEEVDLLFRSQLQKTSFHDLLKNNLEKDRVLQYTSVGIHKDDLLFKINGYPIKKTGSQGQQKSFLIALKLAQFDFIKNKAGLKPILLLDDIFDKLDDHRVGQLLELVNDRDFGQLFISDTHVERTESLIKKTEQSYKMFELK